MVIQKKLWILRRMLGVYKGMVINGLLKWLNLCNYGWSKIFGIIELNTRPGFFLGIGFISE